MPSKRPDSLAYCIATTEGRVERLNERVPGTTKSVFRVGEAVGQRYLLQTILGSGGMGDVFLAHDHRLNRPVAMKVVANRAGVSSAKLQAALADEAKLGAQLNHPAIASVYDFGVQAGQCYVIFEYVDGVTLRDVLERRGRVPLDEVAEVVAAMANALDFAHAQDVVHLDLKPENVCIARNGQLKILDLGIARHLHQSDSQPGFMGTPAYAAPEQAACRNTDARADQYSLALVAYELIAGRRAFEAEDTAELLRMQQEVMPAMPSAYVSDLPPDVDAAMARALMKIAGDRFATCQEFAEAMGCQSGNSSRLATILVPAPERIGVFVSHTSGDSLLARQLAELIEPQGFSTWYYQRDALPGISYQSQTKEAIRRSSATVLLMSRASLRSRDLANEIVEAHQAGCPFLPVLVDLTVAEFESHPLAWRSMLGSAAVIELDRLNFADTATRLAAALRVMGVQPKDTNDLKIGERRDLIGGQIWATDANQIDINDLHKIVFRNDIVDDFLNRRNKCFLSATKGLGKTLLLTYKRLLLTRQHRDSEDDKSLTLVPSGRPFLDFMSEMKSLSKKHERPLSDLNTTKRVWNAALRIAALSHHPDVIDQEEAFELEAFPRRVQRWLGGVKIEPTVVFKELTNLSIGEFNRLIDDTEGFLDQKLRMIHSPTYFFVDKVDQAIRQLSREAWTSIQAGLIEAAWDLMNANSHIKVLATIRHEAFANYESEIKSNLYGATTLLRYTESELLDMMDNLSRCYEDCQGFKDFVGLNVIKHERRPLLEDSFQFVRRHTFGRPRDLVAIASELSTNRSARNEKDFAAIVRKTATTALVSNVFDEMHAFLDCLRDRDTRLRFLANIPHNIIEREEAIRICAEFNGLPDDGVQHYGEDSTEIFHPFRDLYATGLLGIVKRDLESRSMVQSFRQPDELVADFADLPVSRYYFVHPALNDLISRNRTSADYHVFQHIAVGENAVWEEYDPIICAIERYLVTTGDRKTAEDVHQLLNRVTSNLKSGERTPLERMLEGYAPWRSLQQQWEAEGHDDLLLWMSELIAGQY